MIKYRTDPEKKILLHYAQLFKRDDIEKIINAGEVVSAQEAENLAAFFWVMVDQTVLDQDAGVVLVDGSLEDGCQSIMQSLRSHFIAQGFIAVWERESDKA